MSESILSQRSYGAPFVGFGFFISRPDLWWKPFFTAFFTWAGLFILFIWISYLGWPTDHAAISWAQYAWDIFHSFAIATIAVLLAWAFLLPIFLNLALEKMICSVYREKKVPFRLQNWKSSSLSSLFLLLKTAHWRIFWPVISILFIFIFSPLAILIAQIGMGHIAVLDASDLSLLLLGYSGKDRLALIKRFRISLLMAGISAGVLSMLLLTTIIGWIFWLPGVYVGLALFWKKKLESFMQRKRIKDR